MKILFLTSRLPFPPVGGDKIRTFHFIRYLSERHSITLISFIEQENELNSAWQYEHYFDKLITVKLSRTKSYQNCLRGLLKKDPLQVHYYFSKKMKEKVAAELKNGYDTIYCHLIRMAQYLPKNNSIQKVVDLTDAMSLNYQRSRQFRKGVFSFVNRIEAERVLDYELKTITSADSSLFISNVDSAVFSDNENKNKINVISNGVDLEKFTFHQQVYDENQILFLGNMRTFPNSDAVMYFVKGIFPLLLKSNPGLKFHIVGNQPIKKVRKLHNGKNLFVTGYVESIIPYIENAAVMVAPMRVGAGIQNKILESMAIGTPVVTTSIGAEGLDTGKLTIADSAAEFYSKVMALTKDKKLRKEKAIIAREYIEKNFSWEKELLKLESCLQNGHKPQEGSLHNLLV